MGLSVAIYRKAFTEVATVTLETDTAGNQLQEASDVKMRGVIVGEVRKVAASAEGATIELAIQPDRLDDIPADVSVRLLPKTLFGERFVSLEIPEQPSDERLADGDVIGQDRSQNAIELERVIDDTLPLLQAVAPEDLSYTLGAVADALRGRGDSLGENLAAQGRYFAEINTVMPQLQANISGLADFADTYESAADDLLAVLDNLAVVNTTMVDQSEQLRRTFTVGESSAGTMAGFFEANERNMISLAATSRPVLDLFAEYSPIYPCLLNGLTRYAPIVNGTFAGYDAPALNLNLTVVMPPRNHYMPGDQPEYLDERGPDCAGLTRIDEIDAGAEKGEYYCPERAPADGVESKDNPSTGDPVCMGGRPGEGWEHGGAGGSAGHALPRFLAGSTAELEFVKSILGYQTGLEPGGVSDLSASTMAPLLRGTRVMLR
jgi:virulence factor Mce-like protein